MRNTKSDCMFIYKNTSLYAVIKQTDYFRPINYFLCLLLLPHIVDTRVAGSVVYTEINVQNILCICTRVYVWTLSYVCQESREIEFFNWIDYRTKSLIMCLHRNNIIKSDGWTQFLCCSPGHTTVRRRTITAFFNVSQITVIRTRATVKIPNLNH